MTTLLRGKPQRRFAPRLDKRLIACQEGHNVYAVNAFAVRNTTQPDEEFGNFATSDQFPDVIEKTDIWISDRVVETEATFFIANALAQLAARERGLSNENAYEAGQEAEQDLRERIVGVKYRDGKPHRHVPEAIYAEPYLTLDDPEFPVKVWRIDGNLVRSYYKTDYTEGGHGQVYPWVPKREIWVEKDLDRREVPFILSHEYLEMRLMRDEGIDYDTAHETAARMEFDLRKGKGIARLLVPGRRRRLTKKDLPRLVGAEVFAFFKEAYLQE